MSKRIYTPAEKERYYFNRAKDRSLTTKQRLYAKFFVEGVEAYNGDGDKSGEDIISNLLSKTDGTLPKLPLRNGYNNAHQKEQQRIAEIEQKHKQEAEKRKKALKERQKIMRSGVYWSN